MVEHSAIRYETLGLIASEQGRKKEGREEGKEGEREGGKREEVAKGRKLGERGKRSG